MSCRPLTLLTPAPLVRAPANATAYAGADMTTHTSAHVSAAEAARMYGLSEKTVRRWIKSGRLRAGMVQGAYSVALDDVAAQVGGQPAHVSVPTSAQGADTSTDIGTDIPEDDVRPADQTSMALAQAEAMAAYTRSLLEPMVTLVAEQQTTIRDQAETIGTLRAERDAAETQMASILAAQSEPASSEPAIPVWRTLWPWLVVVVLVVAGTVLVAVAAMTDLLILVAIIVFAMLLVLALWRRGGPHSEEPPEKR
jgi:excisionase family DNA binding protein